jgi:hypothetical protein
MWSPAEEYTTTEPSPHMSQCSRLRVADPPKVKKQAGKSRSSFDILKGEEIGYTSVSKAAAVTESPTQSKTPS